MYELFVANGLKSAFIQMRESSPCSVTSYLGLTTVFQYATNIYFGTEGKMSNFMNRIRYIWRIINTYLIIYSPIKSALVRTTFLYRLISIKVKF